MICCYTFKLIIYFAKVFSVFLSEFLKRKLSAISKSCTALILGPYRQVSQPPDLIHKELQICYILLNVLLPSCYDCDK